MAHPLMYILPAVIALGGVFFGIFIHNQNQQQAYSSSPNNRNRRPNRSSDFVDAGGNCIICSEGINEVTKKYLECGHCFHNACINKWLNINSACPNCKTPIRL